MKSILSAMVLSLVLSSSVRSADAVFPPGKPIKFKHPTGLKTPGPRLWLINSREWRGHPERTVIIHSSVKGYVRMCKKGNATPVLVRYETVDFNAYDFGDQIPMSPNEE